jgi:hypothetical protein
MDVTTAIMGRFREIGAEPGKPVVNYEIGAALSGAGFDQHEIVNGPYRRQLDGFIQLMPFNALRLLKSI